MTHKLIKDFRYKGRRCIVLEIFYEIPNSIFGNLRPAFNIKPYCNGYIEIKDKEAVLNKLTEKKKGSGFLKMIDSAEITYQGDIRFDDLDLSDGHFYIGFDSAHAWNDAKPESKTAVFVEKVCKKIVDELNERFTRC